MSENVILWSSLINTISHRCLFSCFYRHFAQTSIVMSTKSNVRRMTIPSHLVVHCLPLTNRYLNIVALVLHSVLGTGGNSKGSTHTATQRIAICRKRCLLDRGLSGYITESLIVGHSRVKGLDVLLPLKIWNISFWIVQYTYKPELHW